MRPVEVIVTEQRRRRWTTEEKRRMVEETSLPGNSVSSVARQYGVHPNQLFKWKRLVQDGGYSAISSGEGVVPVSEVKALRQQVRELERLLGRKTMETEILRDALKIAHEKKLISRMPLLPRDDIR